jgi:hypothetical protein
VRFFKHSALRILILLTLAVGVLVVVEFIFMTTAGMGSIRPTNYRLLGCDTM